LPEESAFFLGLVKKQIPRFARDDIKLLFSAASEAVIHKQSRVIKRALKAMPSSLAAEERSTLPPGWHFLANHGA
jgi:hypothetical protein